MKHIKLAKLNVTITNKIEHQQLNRIIHDSIPTSVLAISSKIIPMSAQIIYGHIFTQIDEEGTCYKSNSTIAKDLNVNVTTVSHSIKKCVKLNLLSAKYQYEHKNGRRILYFSPSNFRYLIRLDNKFREYHKLPLNKRYRKSIKHNDRRKHYYKYNSKYYMSKRKYINRSKRELSHMLSLFIDKFHR